MTARINAYDDIHDQATAWLVNLSGRKIGRKDREEFALWLARSKKHRQAFSEILELWRDLGAVRELPLQLDLTKPRSTLTRRKAWLGWQGLAAVAASAFAAIVLMFSVGLDQHGSLNYQTGIGERTEYQLTDGSEITLNTNTVVTVDFLNDQRRVHFTRGEAYFEVAADRTKPFVTACGPATATAVGTAFNVRCETDRTEVTVTEGIVRVAAAGEVSGVLVRAGEHLVFDHASRNGALGQGEQDARLAWLENSLIFEDARLDDVVSELQRYTQTRIRLADPRISGLRVSGRFTVRDPELAVEALVNSLPIEARRQDGGQILILPKRG